MHWAVMTYQLDLIDRLLEQGVDINAHRADGQTPALLSIHGDYWFGHAARERDDIAPPPGDRWVTTRYLVDRGAEYTLSVACLLGDVSRVRQILRQSPEQARRLDSSHTNPLTYAAGQGHTEIVQLLLDGGADPSLPETRAPQGRALFSAAAGNHLETAALLLAAGADANAGEDSSGSCLTIVEHRYPQECGPMVELLREHGARKPPYAMSVEELKEAVQSGEATTLEHDQFLHELLSRGDAALFDTVLEEHPEIVPNLVPTDIWGGDVPEAKIVRRLLVTGLDPNRANWIGRTFLHVAAEQGAVEVAEALLEAGAELEAVDLENGSTPLGSAVRKEQREMVAWLLERGADADGPVESPYGSARAMAMAVGNEEIQRLIEGR